MALFESLSDRMNHIFSKLRNKGKLTELEIKQAMREIRVALLEADVNYNVVKDFTAKVSEKALGEDILKSLTPAQQIVKIVNDELCALMGSTHQKLAVSDKQPTIYMMCGLQGAGKTTMCGKLATYLKKQNKKVLLVAGDIYRPAAIQQLHVVAKKANTECFDMGQVDPVKIAKAGVEYALKNGYDTMIIDTAGRLHIDEALMQELINVKNAVKPTEILLVVDSMTGQDAVTVAQTFNDKLDITGVIMSKMDGDTRGGAALSVREVTGRPIKFCGTGEKLQDIEPFYPDRMASRILGMGDMLTLIEKAQNAFDEKKAQELATKLKTNDFTLEDFMEQMEQVKSMGSMEDILAMMPGANAAKLGNMEIDEKQTERMLAIVKSMTPEERRRPELLNASRRRRIAAGSGNSIQEVNRLLNQFEATRKMMRQFAGGKLGKMKKGRRGFNPFGF